jgi:hypothetical protein
MKQSHNYPTPKGVETQSRAERDNLKRSHERSKINLSAKAPTTNLGVDAFLETFFFYKLRR